MFSSRILDTCTSYNVTASFLVLSVTLFILHIWRRNSRLPPGPLGLPFFGYYPFLQKKAFLDFARLSRKYGNVFSFRTVGGKLFVVLSGAKTIRDVLVNRSEEFIGRPLEDNLLAWISDGLGVTQEEGVSWKEHRRYFLQTVKNFGFGKLDLEATIHDEIRTLLKDLRNTEGRPTDLRFHVAYAVNSVIMRVMFNRKLEKNSSEFQNLAAAVQDVIENFAINRFMLVGTPFSVAMKLLPWSRKVRRGRQFLKKIASEIVDDHVRNFDPANIRDYVDSYLLQRDNLRKSGELQKSSFTMERLVSISMNMIMEGTESVTDTIVSLLAKASERPIEQKLVQREIDQIVDRESLPSWSQKKSLPYMEAFIQELFRTAQAFYVTTHYCNFEETTINGYMIPQRSIIVGNLWTINNDPELYPDPYKFDVGRFLDENGTKKRTEGPYPFSMGKRDCVGQSLAQMELFLIISSILQRFTLQPSQEERGFFKVIPRH